MNRVYQRRWLRFAKGGKTRYIGHLDLLKVFQSAIRRAKLPIAYSMGFNPHQRLSFALPLPLGMDSVGEYIELLLNEPMPPDILQDLLGKELPNGLALLSAYAVPEDAPRPAAAVTEAEYRIIFPDINQEHLHGLLAEKELLVMKKTKSGEKLTDIRPDILALNYEIPSAVLMRLSAGSTRNVSPLLVTQALFERMGVAEGVYKSEVTILRRGLYGRHFKNNKTVPLHEVFGEYGGYNEAVVN